ncbi:MAG: glycosyltransferase [Candidatus Woesearchaeota archaeon]
MIELIVKTIILISLFIITFYVITLIKSEYKPKNIKEYPEVTILIPAYNEEQGIQRTIESAKNLDYPGKVHIIIIDDASKDKTAEIAKKYLIEDTIKLIQLPKNQGKANAMNYALKQVKTEYFAVLDADSVVDKKSLKKLMTHFYMDRGEPVGAVMSKLKPENEDTNVYERIQVIEYLIVGLMRALSASLRFLHIAPGVLSAYKTYIIKKIGGFDTKNLTEDFELGVRLKKNGYLIDYAHESLAYTKTPNTLNQIINQRIRWFRGFFRTHIKHKDIHFNKKHGLFGLYEFPITVFGLMMLFIGITILSYNIYKAITQFLFKLIYTPDVIVWFEIKPIQDYLLTTDITIIMPILLLLIITLFMVRTTIKFYESNFFTKNLPKKIIALFLYIMIYNYIYVYIIPKSIYLELKGKKYDWGTKK